MKTGSPKGASEQSPLSRFLTREEISDTVAGMINKIHPSLNAWYPVPEGFPLAMQEIDMTAGVVITHTPFAMQETNKGETVVASLVDYLYLAAPSTGRPFLRVAIPGVCGHMECGGVIEVCLN